MPEITTARITTPQHGVLIHPMLIEVDDHCICVPAGSRLVFYKDDSLPGFVSEADLEVAEQTMREFLEN